MTDSATNASATESSEVEASQSPAEIIDRLEQYKEDNPNCVEYWVKDEEEAAYLLLAMAASLKHLETDVNNDVAGIDQLRHYANEYRKTVSQGKAMDYLANLSKDNQLSVWGMRIRALPAVKH